MRTVHAPAPSRLALVRVRVAAAALLACAGIAAHAQTLPARLDAQALIGNGVALGATGVVALNEASGLDNAQTNQGVLMNGLSSPFDLTGSAQLASASAKLGIAQSTIGSNAFSNTSGLIELNQSAGVANLQRNSAVIGTGPVEAEVVSDGVLSGASAKGGGLVVPGGSHDVREVSIGQQALQNVSGVVQINQTAGSGNVSSNSFVLRPPAGTFF